MARPIPMYFSDADPQEFCCPSVLLVEADDFVRGTLGEFLIRQGYLVIAARDSDEALRLSHQVQHIDVLLTDVSIPGSSGRQLAGQIANVVAPSRVLYLSGCTAQSLLIDGALGRGSSGEPFTFSRLADKLRQLVGRGEG